VWALNSWYTSELQTVCCMRTGVRMPSAHIIRRSPVRGWLGPVYDALYGLYNHSRQTRSDQAVCSISACRISKKLDMSWTSGACDGWP
jgi:hypothetical protein